MWRSGQRQGVPKGREKFVAIQQKGGEGELQEQQSGIDQQQDLEIVRLNGRPSKKK